MLLDYKGNPLSVDKLGAPIETYVTPKTKQIGIKIWWNKVPAEYVKPGRLNKVLDSLDNEGLEWKPTEKDAKTISTYAKLKHGYFIRNMNEKNEDWIEVCGIKSTWDGLDSIVFRYKVVSMNQKEGLNPWQAYEAFKKRVEYHLDTTLTAIFGELPGDFHQYRDIVPSPANWATLNTLMVFPGCVKADISSAYGTEASKPLPDLHARARKVVKGRVEPTAEYPFAFYLKSKKMAIWNEGTSDWYNQFGLWKTDKVNNKVKAEDDETLLCKAAKTTLEPIFQELYAGRKECPENKDIMNYTIGYWHKKKFREGRDDNYWPLSAVVKFRCNKRITDLYLKLKELGQYPILINTDSITWIGTDKSLVDTEKKLGSFSLEYDNCRVLIGGPKKYQIEYEENGKLKALTKWAGPHKKEYTEKLPFGAMLDKKVQDLMEYEEAHNTIRWDKIRRRYVNRLDEIYYEENSVLSFEDDELEE